MAIYPEETLNLGYFPADIGQSLDEGTYTVIRKLGWGSQSSTWLVREVEDGEVVYWAAQLFTVSSSKEKAERLLPTLQNQISDIGEAFPNFRRHFWQKSVHGDHFCLIVSTYGLPILSLLDEAIQSGNVGLPVHTVQYATSQVLEALSSLHSKKYLVMHGGVKAKNVVFTPALQTEELQPYIDSSPPPTTTIIDGLPCVRSQPLDNEKHEWNEPMSNVCDWSLDLVGYTDGLSTVWLPLLAFGVNTIVETSVAQILPYKPEEGVDYSSAPETIAEHATCGLQTDIWMLGCLVFQLLTGKEFVAPGGTREERIARVRDGLQDGVLEQRLKATLADEDAAAAVAFLKKCLVFNPDGRSSAKDLSLNDEWVGEGSKCSCCYN